MTAKTPVAMAARQKDIRQPHFPIMQGNKMGEVTPPSPAPAAIKPQTRARSLSRIQLALVLAHEGYSGPVKNPIASRTRKKDGTIPDKCPDPVCRPAPSN